MSKMFTFNKYSSDEWCNKIITRKFLLDRMILEARKNFEYSREKYGEESYMYGYAAGVLISLEGEKHSLREILREDD